MSLTNPHDPIDRLARAAADLHAARPSRPTRLVVVVPESIRAQAEARAKARAKARVLDDREEFHRAERERLNREQLAALTRFDLRLDRPWRGGGAR